MLEKEIEMAWAALHGKATWHVQEISNTESFGSTIVSKVCS